MDIFLIGMFLGTLELSDSEYSKREKGTAIHRHYKYVISCSGTVKHKMSQTVADTFQAMLPQA